MRTVFGAEDKGDPRYEEGLSIIRGGAELLAKRLRADMPGFRLVDNDAERQAKYTRLVEKKAKRQTPE